MSVVVFAVVSIFSWWCTGVATLPAASVAACVVTITVWPSNLPELAVYVVPSALTVKKDVTSVPSVKATFTAWPAATVKPLEKFWPLACAASATEVMSVVVFAVVSKVNVCEVALGLWLPAASVVTAVTVIVPSCKEELLLPISVGANATATGVAPLPVTVLVTTCPDASVKVTTTFDPDSAVTWTAPLAPTTVKALSAAETGTTTGCVGAVVSITKVIAVEALPTLPAKSVLVDVTLIVSPPANRPVFAVYVVIPFEVVAVNWLLSWVAFSVLPPTFTVTTSP